VEIVRGTAARVDDGKPLAVTQKQKKKQKKKKKRKSKMHVQIEKAAHEGKIQVF